ncbi:hypothetical protein OEZ85_005388 [Tetradesmus obliquus]|uniref:Guanylate cyclase domain-containing protein n=1 Tax=Tetradesmus obliquus TaxID=3088 RepID=A0ABY8UHS3_TETOB|nr:hypothetical protein OEZ85_005388 [Tetradesmus obliquus]
MEDLEDEEDDAEGGLAVDEPPPTPVQCPGVTSGVCEEQCQLHVCKQLAAFYKATNNINPVNGPWDEEAGWEQTSQKNCSQLLAAAARSSSSSSSAPAYCSWFGVTCCSAAVSAAGRCSPVNAVAGVDLPLNNLNASISDDSFMAPLLQLHGCGLTVANLEQNCFDGSMTDAWGKMVNLRHISLANTWITGTIPDSLRNLRNLTKINLSNTFLSGTLPPWLPELTQLATVMLGQTTGLGGAFPRGMGQLDKLRELNLEGSALTGTLPDDLCHHQGTSKLLSFNIRRSGLSGNVYAPLLRDLDISNNQVGGIIPSRIGLMLSLETINLANNQFTGPLTEYLFYFPGLRQLDLSNNQLVGTIPAYALMFTVALLSGDLSNNSGITGIIPPQMGFAGDLRRMLIVRRAPEDARAACSGSEPPFFLGGESESLPDNSLSGSEQAWVIDPGYYQYRGCSCLLGFKEYPDAMIKAMGGHNNIMRKACHMHAGYVLDQEGDSWAVAFHDADDAVAFSLQVQQASRNGNLAGPLGSNTAQQQQKQQLKALRISVRIGIASGTLLYGSDLQNCDVPQRAKELVSDVANGGQVLIDEPTFLLVKDSLSLLGTVSEAGYDDRLLQRLNQARVVGRLQQQVACATACSRHEASFSSPLPEDEPQDYEHDAIVVHMGRFAAETPLAPGQPQAATSSKEDDTKATGDQQQQQQQQQGWKGLEKLGRSLKGRSSKAESAGGEDGAAAAAAATAAPAAPAAAAARGKSEPNMELLFVGNSKDQRMQSGKKGAAASKQALQVQQLHLYSIASPGMRRWPEHTQDLSAALAWAEPVNMKRGWAQLQKGFFQAPGARKMDLSPSAQQSTNHQAPLPDVTIVFASVADSLSFTAKQSRATVRGVHAAIVRVLLAQMEAVAGGDGYLCRCQEGAFQYMVAFEQPHHAVQWCLLVQEALLYEAWEPAVLRHPGFEPVTCPNSGRSLFAGPRLRMGLAEGPPHSVLPDHSGRANYAGPSVIRAARFMDAAAHGGQVVTNLELLRKLAIGWVAEQTARGPAAAAYRPWKMNGLNDKAADVLGYQLDGMAVGSAAASSLDAVLALHLGQFRFKGSGEYDMVSLLHGALAGRAFPVEPPRGKGERLPGGVSPGVAVRDLPAVALRPPLELLAAREGLQQQQQQQQYAQEEV